MQKQKPKQSVAETKNEDVMVKVSKKSDQVESEFENEVNVAPEEVVAEQAPLVVELSETTKIEIEAGRVALAKRVALEKANRENRE
jgi:hypothetical protein